MALDPWAVQPHERAKFKEHFDKLGAVGGLLTGEQAKRFMLQSQLPLPVLGQIWFLADTNTDGQLDLREFSIACKIINLKLHGVEIPKALPPSLVASLAVSPTVTQPAQPPLLPTPPKSVAPLPASAPSNQSLLGDLSSPPITAQPIQAKPIIPAQPMLPPVQHMVQPMVPPVQSIVQPQMPMVPPAQPLIPSSQPLIPTGQPLIPTGQPLIPTGQPLNQPLIQPTQPAVPDLISTSMSSNQSLLTGLTSPPNQTIPPIAAVQPLVGIGQPVAQQLVMGTTVAPAISGATSLVQSPPKTLDGIANSSVGAMVTSTPISTAQKDDILKPGILSPSNDVPLGVMSPMSTEWAIPQQQKLKYTQLFNSTDRAKAGAVSGAQARSIMLTSRLPQQTLAHIWMLADLDSDGKLGCDEFVLAMYLCELATQGETIPAKLPRELIPPTFRRDSVTSNSSASSYEERRKDNMARGQAELERRRAALAETQAKEKAERQKKEREDLEKREKARLEQQRKEQEELKRKQKEEQEKRDAARKEMERQCQLEWEKKRMRELEARRSEERASVGSLKARSAALTAELTVATNAGASLAKNTRETRTQLATIKRSIDAMRSERDASMQEMSTLKARVKELNAKQIALNHEKAQLDAKAKASEGAGEDGKLNMMEVTLKQLKDKLDAAKAVVESKRADVDSHSAELNELTQKVTELTDKCAKVWALYEEKRRQYEESRSSAPAEGHIQATSAWGDDAWGSAAESAWGDDAAPAAPPAAEEWPAPPAAAARWRCVFEFEARAPDELSLQPGDVVCDAPAPRASAQPGWRWGTTRGQSGWYPESYVEDINASSYVEPTAEVIDTTKTPLEGIAEVPETLSEAAPAEPTPAPAAAPVDAGDGEIYVAAYSYCSGEPGDLVFEAGERIRVVRADADWWTGVIGDRTGIFPSNYVTKLTEQPEPAAQPTAAAQPEPQPTSPVTQGKSTTPICSEVAAITDARPASVTRRDSGRDSVTGRKKQEIAQVLANYTANSSEQLSLTKGQLLVVRKKTDSGWWEGELQAKGRNRQLGWFPASYVKVLQSSGRTSGRTTPVLSSKIDPGASEVVIDKVIALYPYTAQNADELSFDKDDIISVTDREQDPAWWMGELRGTSGLFPSNYVTKLVN